MRKLFVILVAILIATLLVFSACSSADDFQTTIKLHEYFVDEELPEIYMRSNAGISFSVMNPSEPQIEMTYHEDRGNLDLHLISVTQKYDPKLEKWDEKELQDNPYSIGVVFD